MRDLPDACCPSCRVSLSYAMIASLRNLRLAAILASIMVTCKRQGKRLLDLARRLWPSSDPPAIPLDSPPGG